ncbi:MAG: hypothetical protein COA79_19520 [Planctomycetota bacterium]|nr:MAG: hypothetical protein COA79_19520 [Planctomycetota bacterium]
MGLNSIQVALSGMKATQGNIDVIGHNISNVNTIGFKGSSYHFQSIFSNQLSSQSAEETGSNDFGQGVTGAVLSQMDQGTLARSTSDKDMAIDGEGFFVLSQGDTTEYSRAGIFRPQQFGEDVVLVDETTGFILQGWNADYPFTNAAPDIDTNDNISNIKIPIGSLERGRASNFVNIMGNLNASEPLLDEENIIKSVQLTDGTAAATDATNLKDLVSLTANNNEKLFEDIDTTNGEINIKVFKDNREVTETFVYGTDGTTLGDFANWMENALGISKPTSPSALFNPTGVTVENGAITIASGVGANQFIQKIELNYKNDNEQSNILDFTNTLSENQALTSNTGIMVLDEEGKQHPIDVIFTKSKVEDDGTTWSFNLESSEHFDATGIRLIDSGTVKFGLNGEFLTAQPNLTSFSFKDDAGATKSQILNLDFSKMTQLSSALGSELSFVDDGFPKSTLTDYYIGDEGIIMGVYEGNFTEEIAQISIATVINPENFIQTKNGYWAANSQFQNVTISTTSVGKAGNIKGGFTEQSNVDLTEQFAKLIIAQRSFQSASNALKVSNEILKSLSDLGR